MALQLNRLAHANIVTRITSYTHDHNAAGNGDNAHTHTHRMIRFTGETTLMTGEKKRENTERKRQMKKEAQTDMELNDGVAGA